MLRVLLVTAREAALACLVVAVQRLRDQTEATPDDPDDRDRAKLDDAEREVFAALGRVERYGGDEQREDARSLIATALRMAVEQWEGDEASMLREAEAGPVPGRAGYRRMAGQFQQQSVRARALLEVFDD